MLHTEAETFRNPQRIPLPVDPYAVTTGDLNGDGRNDIVWVEHTLNPETSVLHVLLAGANGQYTSAPSLSLPANYNDVGCVIEDVTGDKQNDLICVGVFNSVDVSLFTFSGNGDGTFASPVQTALTAQSTFSGPILARSGDLNGDGLSDIILMSAYYSNVLPFLSDGHGGFRAAASFQGSFNYSVPTIADLNGDGKLDVLWPTGPRVNLGNGDGTFPAPAQYDPGFDSNCAFGDVDHDGHLDAVCTWLDSGDIDGFIHLTVLHGNPDGTFSKTPLFTRTFGTGETEYDGLPTIITPVLVADLNGDGYADIISLSGDGYCVLLGGPNATWNGQPQQFITASSQSQGGLTGINGVSIADMNGDGLPDIVAVGANGLYITYAQHDGSLSSAPAPEVGQVSASATLADFNGDGNLDVVSAGDTALKLSLGRGDGTFTSPQPITSSGNFGAVNYVAPQVVSGDFNGDGKQDLLATGSTAAYTSQTYILLGHGDGSFDNPKAINISPGKVADLNGDGLSDVYSVQNNALATNVLIANISHKDGTFTTVSTNLPSETSNSFVVPSSGPALADFRHSGRLDAVIASVNNAYVLPSHGDGTFDSTGTALPIPGLPNLTNLGSYDVASGDFDGDGNPDFAVLVEYGNGMYNLSTPTSAAWVFYGNGDGTFSTAVLAGTFNRDAQTLSAGDLDGDGLADLVLTSNDVYQYTGVLIVHALPHRAWGPEVDYTGGAGMRPLWITDINHDGRNDLVFSNAGQLAYAADSVSVLLNQVDTVTGTLTASPEPSNVTNPFTLTAVLGSSIASDTLSGNVTFSLDGNVVGTGALTGNTAALALSGTGIAAGTHTLSATWPGDATFPPLTLSGSHTVSLLPLNISLAATPTSLGVGGTVTATATFTPGVVPNQAGYQFVGTMTLYDNGVAIAHQQPSASGFSFALPSLTAGSHTLSLSYPGDSLFSTAQSNSVVVTVTGAPSVATLNASPSTGSYGTAVTLAATISAATPASLPLPTGTVTFTIDGNPLSPVALSDAVATDILNNLSAGTHTVSCTYSGDSNFAPSTCNAVNVSIQPGVSALTITSSQNPSLAYTPVTFTIHLTLNGKPAPAGTQFTFSLFANSGNFVLTTDASGTATYITSELFARTWLTEAIFSAANYATSTAQYAQLVTSAPTTLTLAATPNPAYSGQTVSFTATTTGSGKVFPTGAITFLDGGIVLGTGSLGATGQAVFSTSGLAIGTHAITATYSGDPGFSAATSPGVNEVVLNSGFTIALSPPSITLRQGATGTTAIQLASIGNFAGPLALTYGKLPNYATASINSANTALTAGGNHVSTLTFNTVFFPTTAATATGRKSRGSYAAFSAFLLLLAPLSFKQRRVLRIALLLVSLQAITACGYIGEPGELVAPGTYQVPITATDISGGTQSAMLTVIVTPQ